MSTQDLIREALELIEQMALDLRTIDVSAQNLDDALQSSATYSSGDIYLLFHNLTETVRVKRDRVDELLYELAD